MALAIVGCLVTWVSAKGVMSTNGLIGAIICLPFLFAGLLLILAALL